MTSITESITIRPAYGDDHEALVRLAALDSADQVPSRPILLAEVDGEVRAAMSLRDRSAIADPFHPTVHLVELLQAHADAAERSHERRVFSRRPRLGYA